MKAKSPSAIARARSAAKALFRPGDQVTFADGRPPRMRVDRIGDDGRVVCKWRKDGRQTAGEFDHQTLRKVRPKVPAWARSFEADFEASNRREIAAGARFQRGDIVQLTAGGPPMVVGEIQSDGRVECDWFDGQRHGRASFHHEAIQKTTPQPPIKPPSKGLE